MSYMSPFFIIPIIINQYLYIRYSFILTYNYFCHKNLTVILNFIGVKMTMDSDNASVVGVILPVENRILPILHLILKLTKTQPLFYTFAKNTAVVF